MATTDENNNNLPIEQEIDAIITALTEGDFDEEGQLRVERLRESWRKARELIINHELMEMMLCETARFLRDKGVNVRTPVDRRIVRLAAGMTPEETADLLRWWRQRREDFESDTELQLEARFSTYRAERERVRQELERLYDLGDGDSGGPTK
jgi:hypothetical protein